MTATHSSLPPPKGKGGNDNVSQMEVCDDHNLLRESPRALKSLREKEELFLISTAVDIECKHCGRVDYFVSHSWEDDAVGKSKALTMFARAFESKYGRKPSLWLDKVCIDKNSPLQYLTRFHPPLSHTPYVYHSLRLYRCVYITTWPTTAWRSSLRRVPATAATKCPNTSRNPRLSWKWRTISRLTATRRYSPRYHQHPIKFTT